MIDLIFPPTTAPEVLAVEAFYKAIFAFNLKAAADMMSEDGVYVVHGMGEYRGRDGLEKLLKDVKQSQIARVEVSNVVANNNQIAVQGTVNLEDGSNMTFAEFFVLFQAGHQTLVRQVDSYTVMLS